MTFARLMECLMTCRVEKHDREYVFVARARQ